MCYAGVAEWQTRMFKGHVRKSVGSTPTARTKAKKVEKEAFFFLFKFVSGSNGRKSEGNRVCVRPPRRDSGTASEA